MNKKRLGCLLAVMAGCSFIMACYLLYLSPDRGYYGVKFGLVPAKVFRIHGKVLNQYGQPVEGYKMHLSTFFEKDAASVAHTKVAPFVQAANEKGEFVLDTSPIKLNEVFFDGTDQEQVIEGFYYHISTCSGGDIFSLYHDRWIRDGRWETTGVALNVPHDESREYIYHVGRSGPPQRLVSFMRDLKWAAGTFPDVLWLSVDVLKGEMKEGRCAECDFQIKVEGLSRLWEDQRKEGLLYEFDAGRGGGVQLQGDLFGYEAPPSGYEERVVTQPVKKDGKWAVGWAAKPSGGYPYSPQIYFMSREGQVYGCATISIQPDHNPHGLRIEVKCGANPRGQTNLNGGGSAIPLPVTLPFKEDVPFTDWRKIWAYVDPNKENTIIVEGQKDAVEPGAGVGVIHGKWGGSSIPFPGFIWDVHEMSHADGSFRLSLNGQEGDPLQITVSRPTQDPNYDAHLVKLAPRWRLKKAGTK